MKNLLILIVILVAGASVTLGQITPKRGSELRSVLIETIRTPVKKELKQPIIFRINRLSVSGDWAFLSGEPILKNGRQPDYSSTVYADDVKDGLFDNNIFALMKRNAGKWRVVKHLIGCTDVCYLDWFRLYKAPFEIFGLPEAAVGKTEPAGKASVIKPKRGSVLRKEILNKLRVPVERELKQPIVFRVNDMRVFGKWAFVGGEPLAKNGRTPNYSKTIYKEDVEDGLFDNNVFGLLKKENGQWRVVSHLIGCTDVCYLGWADQYKVPKELFPFN